MATTLRERWFDARYIRGGLDALDLDRVPRALDRVLVHVRG